MTPGDGAPQPGDPAIKLDVKVVPASSRDAIAGWLGDVLKLRVTAPPERGRANAAVERLLAEALAVPPQAVRVVAGGSSPRKLVEISGVTRAQLLARLGRPDRD